MTRFTKRTTILVLIGTLLAFGIVFAQGNGWNDNSAGTTPLRDRLSNREPVHRKGLRTG